MPTYMLLARFTDKTAMAFADHASPKAASRIAAEVERLAGDPPLRGELEHLFFTAGDDELVLVLDMPTQEAAVAFSYALTHRFGVRTRLFPAFDPSQMERIQLDAEVAAKIGGPTDGGKGSSPTGTEQQPPIGARP